MPNVILIPNKTCKRTLQCRTSQFTNIIGQGVTDISISANSECVLNRGENLYVTLGGTDLEKFGESACSPSGVWGGAPEADAIFNILCQNGVNFRTC